MGIVKYGPSQDDRLPDRPVLQALTKKQYSNGMMVDGVHIDSWAPLEVNLDVLDIHRMTIYCRDCGRLIKKGEVAGDAQILGRGWHCIDCLTLPADRIVSAWVITYLMRRKSKQNPGGTKVIYIVNSLDIVLDYYSKIQKAFGDEVNIKKIWTNEAQL